MQPHWKQSTILANGKKIAYTRTGDGSKPALVLAHGFSDNGLCWTPLAEALEADYDVILPDAYGHGKTERVTLGQSSDLPADLAAFVTAMGLNRPVVGGHSMGASTAAQMGARFPAVARALILEDPAWFETEARETPPAAEQDKPNPWIEWLHSLPNLTDSEIESYGRKNNVHWRDQEWPAWIQSKREFDTNVNLIGRTTQPWRETVNKLVVPTLLITADPAKGAIVTPQIAAEAHQINPLVQSVYLEEAGHNIRRDSFDATLAAVRDFLASL